MTQHPSPQWLAWPSTLFSTMWALACSGGGGCCWATTSGETRLPTTGLPPMTIQHPSLPINGVPMCLTWKGMWYPPNPQVAIPISTKNTYPHGRVRVFTGKGMGSPKNTQGFPVPITTSCQHINSCTTSSSAMFSLMFWLTSITGPITSHILEPYTLKMVLKSYVSPCLSLGGRRLTHFVSQPGLLHTGCKKE